MSDFWQDSYQWSHFGFNKAFDSEQVKEINEFLDDNSVAYDKGANPDYKKISTIKHIQFKKIKHLIEPFISKAVGIAERGFGYNVYYPHDDWGLNYNVYDSESNDSYDWHTDYSNRATFDTKLTLLINLSEEPYEGGKFELRTSNQPTSVPEYSNSGSALMFKSHILHRVTPVTSGIRKSLTLFIIGPKFQ